MANTKISPSFSNKTIDGRLKLIKSYITDFLTDNMFETVDDSLKNDLCDGLYTTFAFEITVNKFEKNCINFSYRNLYGKSKEVMVTF